jgi:hypothetical protein
MSFDLETLYSLLPAVHRIRELEQIENGLAVSGFQQEANNGAIQLPLKALLEVIAEQIAVLEDNLAQLYDDQFIETCADWVIPYIGDLVSYSTLHNTSSQSLRSEVAHTISYRKRKGTATLLEQLVRVVTGWDARIVEFFQLISSMQQMNRRRSENRLVDLREGNGEPLARLNTPFDSLAHSVDVRNIATGRGRYNIPNIGIFIWRLGDYSLTNVPAMRAARNRGQCYFFSPLGNNTHLFTHPETEEDVAQLAGPNAVAMPISRSRLTHFLSDYYGVNKSILLTINVGGEDVPILPDPKLPSNRLKRLINISGSLHNSLVDLSTDLTSGAKLDEAKLEELIAKSEDLNIGLDDLYRDQLTREKRDVKKLKQLITIDEDLNYGLDQLASTEDIDLQKLELERLIASNHTLREGLTSEGIDPQQLEELITIMDLSDKLLKDANGQPVTRIDDDGHVISVKEEDSKGRTFWENMPEDKIAIDPLLGRFAFPKDMAPLYDRMGLTPRKKTFKDVRSTFYYGFSADMGGGEYHRAGSFTADLENLKEVPAELKDIQNALDTLKDANKVLLDGVVEITSSGRVEGLLTIHAAVNQRIELRAADFCRPLLALEDRAKPPEMLISGEEGSWVTLNGLVISAGTLRVSGTLHRLTLKHCTLVPGLALTVEGEPQSPLSPSLIVESPYTLVEIDHCIVGGLRVKESASVRITKSIVDATRKDRVAYAGFTVSNQGDRSPGGQLSIENSTLIGTVHTVSMELASNTIFLAQAAHRAAPVDVVRRQDGCVRFSYVPDGSRTPRLYNCQPTRGNTSELVEPHFTSLRYGDPGYCQLLQRSPVKARQEGDSGADFRQGIDYNVEFQQAKNEAAIRQGADDEAEMGAYHDLFQPQRETNLRMRLGEYLRFTMEPGIIYVT